MTPEERLAELGIDLPEAPAAVGAYVPWVRTGNLVVTSFQLPWRGGELAYTGKVGAAQTTEDGYQAARRTRGKQPVSPVSPLPPPQRIPRRPGYARAKPGLRGRSTRCGRR